LAAARTDDESPHAGVRHQHVRSAAEHRCRNAEPVRRAKRLEELRAVACLDQPVGSSADPKRRQLRERRLRAHAIGAECVGKGHCHVRHRPASIAISARSWLMSAASASRGVQTANVIASPGPSWPATLMSAVITVAILGYPPLVWRSAINRIGCPEAGT